MECGAYLYEQIPSALLSWPEALLASGEPREQVEHSILHGRHVDKLERGDGERLEGCRVNLPLEVCERGGWVDLLGELLGRVRRIALLLLTQTRSHRERSDRRGRADRQRREDCKASERARNGPDGTGRTCELGQLLSSRERERWSSPRGATAANDREGEAIIDLDTGRASRAEMERNMRGNEKKEEGEGGVLVGESSQNVGGGRKEASKLTCSEPFLNDQQPSLATCPTHSLAGSRHKRFYAHTTCPELLGASKSPLTLPALVSSRPCRPRELWSRWPRSPSSTLSSLQAGSRTRSSSPSLRLCFILCHRVLLRWECPSLPVGWSPTSCSPTAVGSACLRSGRR